MWSHGELCHRNMSHSDRRRIWTQLYFIQNVMLFHRLQGCCYDENMMNKARLWEEDRKALNQTGNVAKSRCNLKDTTARLLKTIVNHRSIPPGIGLQCLNFLFVRNRLLPSKWLWAAHTPLFESESVNECGCTGGTLGHWMCHEARPHQVPCHLETAHLPSGLAEPNALCSTIAGKLQGPGFPTLAQQACPQVSY